MRGLVPGVERPGGVALGGLGSSWGFGRAGWGLWEWEMGGWDSMATWYELTAPEHRP